MPIRQARPADVAAIAAINVASWQAAYRNVLPAEMLNNMSLADVKKRWLNRLTTADEQVFVCEQTDNIVGYVVCGASRDEDALPHTGEIYGLYLLPDQWGQGHGRHLMTAALDALRNKGFREATLWVLRQNYRAQAFYQAVGFTAEGVDKRETRFNNVVFHQTRYRRMI